MRIGSKSNRASREAWSASLDAIEEFSAATDEFDAWWCDIETQLNRQNLSMNDFENPWKDWFDKEFTVGYVIEECVRQDNEGTN